MEKDIIAQIRALVEATDNTFVNVDIGRWSGEIVIVDSNIRQRNIVSKLYEIDKLLGDILDGDILDTNISIVYHQEREPGDKDMRIVISFHYDN